MRKALHLRSLSGIVAWHKTLRKVMHLHSFSSQPSSTFLGPNLPDVWVPRQNTSPYTLLPQSLQCKFYDVNFTFYDVKYLFWLV